MNQIRICKRLLGSLLTALLFTRIRRPNDLLINFYHVIIGTRSPDDGQRRNKEKKFETGKITTSCLALISIHFSTLE